MARIEHCTSCGRTNVPGTGRSCWVCYGEPSMDEEYMERLRQEDEFRSASEETEAEPTT